MYLGKERRNRVVALVLAGVLVAGAVMALLATMATSRAGVRLGESGAPTSVTSTATSSAGAGSGVGVPVGHQHGGTLPADAATGGAVGHPGRLVAMVVGVVLLFVCGVMVVAEQRRRSAEPDSGEWIS